MSRSRLSFMESPSWSHPSQVFTDTRKVDLFNDPKWETAPASPTRVEPETHRPSRWVHAMAAVGRRFTGNKRGRHSHRHD